MMIKASCSLTTAAGLILLLLAAAAAAAPSQSSQLRSNRRRHRTRRSNRRNLQEQSSSGNGGIHCDNEKQCALEDGGTGWLFHHFPPENNGSCAPICVMGITLKKYHASPDYFCGDCPPAGLDKALLGPSVLEEALAMAPPLPGTSTTTTTTTTSTTTEKSPVMFNANIAEFQKDFSVLDLNGDGFITIEELGVMMRSMDLTEFLALKKEVQDHIDKFFQMLDTDMDYYISQNDLLQLLETVQVAPRTKAQLDATVQEADIDGDGKIDPYELTMVFFVRAIEPVDVSTPVVPRAPSEGSIIPEGPPRGRPIVPRKQQNENEPPKDSTVSFHGPPSPPAVEEVQPPPPPPPPASAVEEEKECVCDVSASYSPESGSVTVDFDLCDSAQPQEQDFFGVYPCSGDDSLITADREWFDAMCSSAVVGPKLANSPLCLALLLTLGYEKDQVYTVQEPEWMSYSVAKFVPDDGYVETASAAVWPSKGTVSGSAKLAPGCYKVLMNRYTSSGSGGTPSPPYPSVCKNWNSANTFTVPS